MAKVGAELNAGGFGRGKCTKEHDRKELRSTQVSGSRKEITPLLLLYCSYIFGSMEVQQWCFQALCERRKMNYELRD
jgi:hypothetical protein